MATATNNIRFEEYSLKNLDFICRLRAEQIKQRPEVCIERARHITHFLRDMSSDNEPREIRYARAVNYFLSKKEPIFFDDNLLAGTTTSKFFGAPVYPELTGLTIWPELDTISTREKNPMHLTKEEAIELNLNIFPYWMDRNILEHTRKRYNNPKCMGLFERFVFFIASKAGTISHTIPNYQIGLEKGVEYIIQEAASKEAEIKGGGNLSEENRMKLHFYQAVQIVLKGIIIYAENLSKKAAELADQTDSPFRKENLRAMSEICRQVPAKPARSFREAVNSLWLMQIAIHAENINMAISPGRLDQILYKYYLDDLNKGRLTDKEAIEILSCLWLKLNDNTNLVPETAEELFGGAGTVPAVTIGGIDENDKDAVNKLTYLMLRVTELLQLRDPSMNARYNYEKNSVEYRDRVVEVIANTKAVPALHNDVVNIKNLQNQGVKTEHARDYAIIGCVELGIPGKSYDASSSIMFNLISALELTLYNGKRPITGDEQIAPATGDPIMFKSFEEFWEAFKNQLRWLISQAIQLNEYFGHAHQDMLPTPLLSAFFEGPMEKGKDLIFGGALYNASGATHIGFADTVDSLNAIEKAVFIDKRFTFKELLKALRTNFEGHESLHAYLINKTPKYGTDDPIARKNSQNLIRFLYELYQGHTNYRAGKYKPGYWTMTNHAGQGKLSGALPNGRKAYKVFASGITPVSQAAGSLTACLRNVAGLNSLFIPSGAAFNLKCPAIEGKDDIKKLAQAVETYFKIGGFHIQFNIMSYQMLIEAKKDATKYPELLVRVSGYSAYFKDLNEAMKDEIITRTEYNIRNDTASSFPEEYKAMLSYQ